MPANRPRPDISPFRGNSSTRSHIMGDPHKADAVAGAAMAITRQPETRPREMLSHFWDAKNDVLPRQGEIDVSKLKATTALLAQCGILKDPLPAPERFIDLRYAKMAGIQ
jgi:hypothetical protein